jgi:hypothetical protein
MNIRKYFRIVLINIAIVSLMVVIVTAIFQKGSLAAARGDVSMVAKAAAVEENRHPLIEVNVPLTPVESGGDGLPEGTPPIVPDTSLSGINASDEALASFSYFRLVGTAFNPRTSTSTFAYNFNGCIYETGGTDNRFMAPIFVPDKSTIKYLRLYYDDTNAGTDITAWITRYQPGVTSEDLTSVTSIGSSGYGTILSSEITHTVDIVNWAYTLIIAPNANASTNSFCGVRVAYYAPNAYAVAVPVMLK